VSLAKSVESLLSNYESAEQQNLAVTRLLMPLSNLIKQPE